MGWIKAVVEKIDKPNLNLLILSISIVTLISGYYYKNIFPLTLIGSIGLLYFILYQIRMGYIFFKTKREANKLKLQREEKELSKKYIERSLIDLWFYELSEDKIKFLLNLLNWETLQNNPEIRLVPKINGFFPIEEKTICFRRDGDYRDTEIVIIAPLKSSHNVSVSAYIVHPYLLELLQKKTKEGLNPNPPITYSF